MRTPVLKGNDSAVLGPGDDERHGTDHGGTIGPSLRDVDLQTQIVPSRSLKYPRLLFARDSGVLVDPVRHTCQACGPDVDSRFTHSLVHFVLPFVLIVRYATRFHRLATTAAWGHRWQIRSVPWAREDTDLTDLAA